MADPTNTPPPPELDMSTAVTDTDRGIVVTVACWLCLVCNILFFGARVHIRWPLKNLVGKDDIACTFAMVFAVVQTALVLSSVDNGFGVTREELDTSAARTVEKMIWTSDLFYVLSVAGGRLATVGLLLRFCAAPDRIRIFRAFMYAVGIYGVVGLLITALRQDILHPWRYTANAAQTNFHRWIAFGCMGIVIDVLTMIAPLYLIWDVQMSRRTKTTVVAAFASRAPTIAFTVLRLVSLSSLDGDNFTWTYVIPEVYTQLEMHYNLIAATIPCLRIFLRAWHTRFLNMALEELDEQAFVEHTAAQNSYAMESVDKSKSGSAIRGRGKSTAKRPDGSAWLSKKSHGVSQATIGGGRRDDDATSENSQKAIVIKHTVDVDWGSGGPK